MKIFYKILIFIIAIILIIFALYYYVGGFSKFDVVVEEMGPYNFVYVDHIGDYKLMYKSMDPLYESLKAMGIDSTLGMGIFYDDPEQVSKEDLRSEAGIIVSDEDIIKISQNENNFNIKKLNKKSYAIVKFPYRNVFSYFIGPQKAYPLLWKYLEDNGYNIEVPGIEIYDVPNKIILYMAEIN